MANTAETVRWEAPPEVKRGHRPSKYLPLIEEVKERPNEWALVMEGVNAASAKVFSQHGLQITTRSIGDGSGRVNVWAMYVQDEAETEAEVEVVSKPRKSAARKRPSRKTPTK